MDYLRPEYNNFVSIKKVDFRNKILVAKYISFIIVEFSFHAENKKFVVWRSENLFSCPRAGKQAVFQL